MRRTEVIKRIPVIERTQGTNIHVGQEKPDEANPEISQFMKNYNLTDLRRKLQALNIPQAIIDGPHSEVILQKVFQQIFNEQRERENLYRLRALIKESQKPNGIKHGMKTGANEGPAKMNSQR